MVRMAIADPGAVDGDVAACRSARPSAATAASHLRLVGHVGRRRMPPARPARAPGPRRRSRGGRGSSTLPPPPTSGGPSPRRARRRHRSPGPRCRRSAWAGCHSVRRARPRQASRACAGARGRDARVAAMHLDLRGHPLHTRVAVDHADASAPTAGSTCTASCSTCASAASFPSPAICSPPASCTTCCSTAWSIRSTGVLDAIAPRQPSVAFEASAVTGGESCRDPVDRVRALAGARLDDGFARRSASEIGGPRGCSHVLTLGASARRRPSPGPWRDRERFGERPGRRAGERVFRRDVVVDGVETRRRRRRARRSSSPTCIGAPAPALARPMERFAASLEVRALAVVDLGRYALGAGPLAERRRDAATLDAPLVRPRRRSQRASPASRSPAA